MLFHIFPLEDTRELLLLRWQRSVCVWEGPKFSQRKSPQGGESGPQRRHTHSKNSASKSKHLDCGSNNRLFLLNRNISWETRLCFLYSTYYSFVLWLRSPSLQYDSVCISSSLETVLWRAKTSSSAVNKLSCSAACCRRESRARLINKISKCNPRGLVEHTTLNLWLEPDFAFICSIREMGFTLLRPRSSSSWRSSSSSHPVRTNSWSTGAAASSTTLTCVRKWAGTWMSPTNDAF